MGWRDDPVVGAPAKPSGPQPRWASDPEVEASNPAAAPVTSAQMASHAPAPAPAPASRTESLIRGAAQGGSLGFGDEAAAGLYALAPGAMRWADQHVMGDPYPDAPYDQGYAAMRDYLRRKNAEAQQANPKTYLTGEIGGGVASAAAAPMSAARAPTLLARLVQAAKTGSKLGSVAGAGASEADSLGGVALDAAGGALGGSLAGPLAEAGLTAGGAVARKVAGRLFSKPAPAALPTQETVSLELPKPNALRRAVERRITPTKEAEFLRSEGVPLTAGQLDPRSPLGQIEEASTSLRYTGPAIAAQRDAAKQGWQQVVLAKAMPPGMKGLPKAGSVAEQLDQLYQGFEPAYAAVKGELVYPAIHMGGNGVPLQTLGKSVGAFDRAVADPSVLADDATRSVAKRFLDNELSRLPQRQGAVAQVPVENLLSMRSSIRTAWRQAKRSQKFDLADLLDNAEGSVTQAIESQVSPATSRALQATDAQYRVYKIVEDAVSRAGDSPSGFTPNMLTQALKAASDRSAFARGGGGDLRQLSSAGRNVFESVSPPTGARLLTVGPLAEWFTGPATFMINRPARAAAERVTPNLPALPGVDLSPRVAALMQAFQRRQAENEELLRALRGSRVSVTGAGAEDDRK